MKWPYPGKHEDEDVNEIPTSYLEWAAENSKNPDAVALAEKVLEYREDNPSFKEPESRGRRSTSRRSRSTRQTERQTAPPENPKKESLFEAEMTIRAMMFLAAATIDPDNPWAQLESISRYVVFNERPRLTDENFDPLATGDEEEEQEPPFMNQDDLDKYLTKRESGKSSKSSRGK